MVRIFFAHYVRKLDLSAQKWCEFALILHLMKQKYANDIFLILKFRKKSGHESLIIRGISRTHANFLLDGLFYALKDHYSLNAESRYV